MSENEMEIDITYIGSKSVQVLTKCISGFLCECSVYKNGAAVDSDIHWAGEKSGLCFAWGSGITSLYVTYFPGKTLKGISQSDCCLRRFLFLCAHPRWCSLTQVHTLGSCGALGSAQGRVSPGRSASQAACGFCYGNGSVAGQVRRFTGT